MAVPEALKVVSESEWIKARRQVLAKEREVTKAMDELAKARRSLPMVKVEKEYKFTTLDGKDATLKCLFGDSKQLIVYHLMFGPETEKACTGCSALCSGFGDITFQLKSRNTSFVATARGKPDVIAVFAKSMNWSFPIVTSNSGDKENINGNDFSLDFQAYNDPDTKPVYYNYMTADELTAAGKGSWTNKGDMPGLSVFYKDDEGNVYHTYSTYARGLDNLAGVYRMLDLTYLGRQESKNGENKHIGDFPLKIDFEEELKIGEENTAKEGNKPGKGKEADEELKADQNEKVEVEKADQKDEVNGGDKIDIHQKD